MGDFLKHSTLARTSSTATTKEAVPFIKWVGGKRNALESLRTLFPEGLFEGRFRRYCEPFLGGGAVCLHLASQISFERIYLSDLNPNVVLAYQTVRDHVTQLIHQLTEVSDLYRSLDEIQQAAFFIEQRDAFNRRQQDDLFALPVASQLEHTVHFIFLNKTCYGGMYRVNNKGFFNVPFGKHKRPQIVAPENLKRIAEVLVNAEILNASYCALPQEWNEDSFVYFDPPYRPVSATSSFTRYYGKGFDDQDQTQLSQLFRTLDTAGASLMLSNSDPKTEDPNDIFFDELYEGFICHRIGALRKINSNFAKRGRKSELVITNYPTAHGETLSVSKQISLNWK